MKKNIFILLLIFSLNSGNCQNLELFRLKEKFDWSKIGAKPVPIDFLKSNFEIFKGNPYSEFEELENYQSEFHFIDIDNDKLDEIIYNGWNGSEGEMIIIYRKQGKTYQLVEKFFGRIKNIQKDKNELVLFVLDYSCCGGYVDHLQTFVFINESKKFQLKESIAKIDETEFPEKFITPFRFEIKNSPYNLRFSPEIITGLTPGSFDFNPIDNENIIAKYKTGDCGTAYAESTDSTGRIWLFVIMDTEPEENNSLFKEGNNEFDNYKTIGWISSRFIERK